MFLMVELRARASRAEDATISGCPLVSWIVVVACGHHSGACGLGAMSSVARRMVSMSRWCATLRPFV
jgi:hypothetical protein